MPPTIGPGPCPPQGCPPPTQIDCISVTKVYDSCFQTETFNQVCADVPPSCKKIAATPGTTVSCSVVTSSATCTVVGLISTGVDDFANATFAVSIPISVTLTSPTGLTCSFTFPVNFLKTVTLCAPEGTDQVCTIASVSCGPCFIALTETDEDEKEEAQVCCQVVVCLVLQSTALVQLLVPTYGFCTPAPCSVIGLPPCPPPFPPQCPPPSSADPPE